MASAVRHRPPLRRPGRPVVRGVRRARGGWSDIGLLLAHDGEGRVLVIRTPEVHNPRHAVDLVTTEVTALKRLDGFFAPRLLAWDAHRLRPWLAVECALDGGASEPAPNLHDFVRQEGTLHRAGLLEVACQLAASLANAHENGLVHGSLTPVACWWQDERCRSPGG